MQNPDDKSLNYQSSINSGFDDLLSDYQQDLLRLEQDTTRRVEFLLKLDEARKIAVLLRKIREKNE